MTGELGTMSIHRNTWDKLYQQNTPISNLMAYAGFLTPSFLKHQECILLEELYDEDQFVKLAKEFSDDTRRIEQAVNCVDLSDVFEIDVSNELFHELAEYIAASWKKELTSKFPSCKFDVEVVDFVGDGAWGIIISQTPSA